MSRAGAGARRGEKTCGNAYQTIRGEVADGGCRGLRLDVWVSTPRLGVTRTIIEQSSFYGGQIAQKNSVARRYRLIFAPQQVYNFLALQPMSNERSL